MVTKIRLNLINSIQNSEVQNPTQNIFFINLNLTPSNFKTKKCILFYFYFFSSQICEITQIHFYLYISFQA